MQKKWGKSFRLAPLTYSDVNQIILMVFDRELSV
jgi:hypothetical protein